MHIPVLGGGGAAAFPLQFPDSKVADISLSTTLIEQLSNDGKGTTVSHGSGCFWRGEAGVYLLTARHVLTGTSPFDDSLLSRLGYVPHRVIVYPAIQIATETWLRTRIELSIDDLGCLQDPQFAELRTDIAALKVPLDNPGLVRCLNDAQSLFEPIMTHIGMDCAIVGYPNTNFAGLMTPIWRRGTIASEPLLPIDGKPMFLLDAATSPGFSGSPVFRRHYGPAPVQKADGSIEILLDRVLTTSFVGIYAGRLQHPHIGGEVPFVFYGNRVPFIAI